MTSNNTACDIPSINLQPFFEDKGVVIGEEPTKDQLEVAAIIHQACQEHGFVHVTHFGVSRCQGELLFAASRDLFDNPNKQQDYDPWNPSHNTGYSTFGVQKLNVNRPPDLLEAFNVRFPPNFDNPSLPKTPESFQSVINDNFFPVLRRAALRYGMACALALGLPTDTFAKTLDKFDQCTVRFLHYPPCDFADTNENNNDGNASADIRKPIRVGEHTDFGAYTFLFLKSGPMGLQVKSVEGGAVGGSAGGEEAEGWKNVVVPALEKTNGSEDEESFGAVINTGAMMARWTNDHWKATAHRVIVPNAEIASKHRYSIAFFVDPDADEMIQVDEKFAVNESCYDPITSREFLAMKLKEMSLSK
jgi:isopenicillin N synthase-like dioxygenase